MGERQGEGEKRETVRRRAAGEAVMLSGGGGLTIVSGGLAGEGFEAAAERLRRAVSGHFGDVRDGEVGGAQECHGAVETVIPNIAAEGEAGDLFEARPQAGTRAVQRSSQIVHRDRASLALGEQAVDISQQAILWFRGDVGDGGL